MKLLLQIILATVAITCVIVCDILLHKIPISNILGRLFAKGYLRMGLSYLIGISIFLIGIRLISKF